MATHRTERKGGTVTYNDLIDPWLQVLWDQQGSDLLLVSGSKPRVRIDGGLRPLESAQVLTGTEISDLVHSMLSPDQEAILEEHQDVDFSLSWQDKARLRGSAFHQRGELALALRMIPSEIPSFEELGLPPIAEWLARLPRGLVLLTGPTGSGKSTTLASIIARINETRALHILTIEDPVEYVHDHNLSAVNQREIGLDSPSFERALRSALREDPDVLLVGEMRDLESIQLALTLAETGHLVFSTLHTNDAAQAIDRIIDVFPAFRQEQIRVQLAASLGAVIAQRLVPKIGGGMVAAFEILVANNPVRNLIREGKTNQLLNVITTNQQEGMCTLEASLVDLIQGDVVTYDDAMAISAHPKELERLLSHRGAMLSTA
ncbi:MAG: type IV pilus twitching motility protein PilT [Acidimicrobiales bacterium]